MIRAKEYVLNRTRFYAMSVPRTYIRCLKDVAVQPDRAMDYARRLGVKPVDLDAGHDVMLSAPKALVRVLESLSPMGRGQG